jgi:hypothetical protein
MTMKISAWVLRYKGILILASVAILVALWWAFRPEKLWINQTVNEAAPFDTSGDADPVFTGQFEGKTGGRVTVFKKSGGGEYLRLSDLTLSGVTDAHVELTKSVDAGRANDAANSIDLGPLKTGEGGQNYDLPAAADLTSYSAVVIDDKRGDSVFAWAKLEAF